MNDLIRVEKSGAERAVDTLARAFLNYPLLTYYVPDEKKRKKLMRGFMAVEVYSGLGSGEVYTISPDFEGIAIWIPPGKYPVSFFSMLRNAPPKVIFGLMNADFWKIKDAAMHIDKVHREQVPYEHYFLQTLGVAPEHQGKGIAGKLLRPMLERFDQEGFPCYLETLDAKNVGIYERFGFTLIDESKIPGTELTNWAMLRKTPTS